MAALALLAGLVEKGGDAMREFAILFAAQHPVVQADVQIVHGALNRRSISQVPGSAQLCNSLEERVSLDLFVLSRRTRPARLLPQAH